VEVQKFPWLGNSDGKLKAAFPGEDTFQPKVPALYRRYLPYGLFALCLFVLFITRSRGSDVVKIEERGGTIEVLAMIFPTGKGGPISPETCKKLVVDRKALSKTQLLQVVREEDLAKLRGRLHAKKNIPPGKVLFWSDLDFSSGLASAAAPSPQIVFPKEVSQ